MNIFVVGHSLGAYIVNLLATQAPAIKEVRGYVSLHGIWDPQDLGDRKDKVVPGSIRPIDRSPTNLRPILIVHTQDDPQVSFSQVTDFEAWVGNSATNYEIKTFAGGGHTPGTDQIDSPPYQRPAYPSQELAKTMLRFLESHMSPNAF